MEAIQASAREIALIGVVLQITPDGKYRTFPLSELHNANNIWGKISKLTEGEDAKKVYVDGNLDLSTDEKAFLKGLVTNHSWGVTDGEYVTSLIEKLS